MSIIKILPLAVSFLALALPISAHAGDDDEELPEICETIKSAECPPKSFSIIELPDGGAAQRIAVHEPFLLHAECRASKSGMDCAGWPQELGSEGNLSYEWSFDQGESKLVFADSSSPRRSLSCLEGEKIIATLTVSNGSYRVSASELLTCAPIR